MGADAVAPHGCRPWPRRWLIYKVRKACILLAALRRRGATVWLKWLIRRSVDPPEMTGDMPWAEVAGAPKTISRRNSARSCPVRRATRHGRRSVVAVER